MDAKPEWRYWRESREEWVLGSELKKDRKQSKGALKLDTMVIKIMGDIYFAVFCFALF